MLASRSILFVESGERDIEQVGLGVSSDERNVCAKKQSLHILENVHRSDLQKVSRSPGSPPLH
jgi:hypothetical protein